MERSSIDSILFTTSEYVRRETGPADFVKDNTTSRMRDYPKTEDVETSPLPPVDR